ncbi:hypothetical protein ATCC90586_011538 [Pythium insidiosum]|nr:hypothetical protein ATCC90586_011538 [Pythium insidiosum]
MKVLCGCLVIVEVFYIFFLKNKLAGFLVVELLLGIEAIMILSSYTVVRPAALLLSALSPLGSETDSWVE